MKQLLKRITPLPVIRFRSRFRDQSALGRLPSCECPTGRLGRVDAVNLFSVFSNDEADRGWVDAEREIAALSISTKAGGVNPGDRRALYYLVLRLRPQSILEVGTHVGASTVALARAQKQLRASEPGLPCRLLSVDIRDVNDPASGPWNQLGSSHSPRDMTERLGCRGFVHFRADSSLNYFSECRDEHDLIFLDGDHSATTVYREIAASVRHLKRGGYIVLHDYFPGMQPLWSNGLANPGPYLATQRLQSEGADLRVLPLGELPWPTKLGSRHTSLALLGRA